jgi:hypothetical protein
LINDYCCGNEKNGYQFQMESYKKKAAKWDITAASIIINFVAFNHAIMQFHQSKNLKCRLRIWISDVCVCCFSKGFLLKFDWWIGLMFLFFKVYDKNKNLSNKSGWLAQNIFVEM